MLELGIFFIGAILFVVSMVVEIRSNFIGSEIREKLHNTVKSGVGLRVAGIALVVYWRAYDGGVSARDRLHTTPSASRGISQLLVSYCRKLDPGEFNHVIGDRDDVGLGAVDVHNRGSVDEALL